MCLMGASHQNNFTELKPGEFFMLFAFTLNGIITVVLKNHCDVLYSFFPQHPGEDLENAFNFK